MDSHQSQSYARYVNGSIQNSQGFYDHHGSHSRSYSSAHSRHQVGVYDSTSVILVRATGAGTTLIQGGAGERETWYMPRFSIYLNR